ncbi:hypothetical protein EDF60_0646 [Leucobacter luti]|uniref:NUDIX hydrolase n=1 Tax=Leucobacter luti TaxID=340320 RepID=UPI0010CF0A59|nr:NUDIX domain-containing protein [Leucobacter luti]MCW2288424.1 ADP-ribose pyrophosphatase YjhB (NUDIX family) [Leucobacter luti]TCK45419.1 hypothetical protein EDF60_0646 [Leucobacter luti]
MQYSEISASARRYLPPAVAVSVVAFALRPPLDAEQGESLPEADETTIWLPLVRRTRAPFLGQWALPGGPTEWNETLGDTALRSLRAAAGRDPGTLEQLYSFGGIERSAEAQRLVTIAYWALYGEHELDADPDAGSIRSAAPAESTVPAQTAAPAEPAAPRRWDDPVPDEAIHSRAETHGEGERLTASETQGDAAHANVAWFSADRLPPLAFDHAEIVAHALARLRARTEYTAVAHRFLGPVFTLGRLRAVTEAVRGHPVDPANFRRQVLAQGSLIDTGEVETGARHRPARLYRFGDASEASAAAQLSHPVPTPNSSRSTA